MPSQLTIILWTNANDQSLASQLGQEACALVRRTSQMPCEVAHAEVTPLEPSEVQAAVDAYADAAAADLIAERVNDATPPSIEPHDHQNADGTEQEPTPPETVALAPGEPEPHLVDDETLVSLFAGLPNETRDAIDAKVVTRSDAEAAIKDAYAELGLTDATNVVTETPEEAATREQVQQEAATQPTAEPEKGAGDAPSAY